MAKVSEGTLEQLNKEDLSVKKGGTAEVTFRPFVGRRVFVRFCAIRREQRL
jgi:hypothetical protein